MLSNCQSVRFDQSKQKFAWPQELLPSVHPRSHFKLQKTETGSPELFYKNFAKPRISGLFWNSKQ